MDFFKSGKHISMKMPTRPAPAVPSFAVKKYSPVTNWDDDPFEADIFENVHQHGNKKKPPPRPPPPKVNQQNGPKPYSRKPTVLDSLLNRRTKNNNTICTDENEIAEFGVSSSIASKLFRKCEPKNIQTGTLIDLSSPPSSPTFTTRSSSDGLSIDSFGSDATNSNHQANCGSSSQAESGFEDDFEYFLSKKTSPSTLEDSTDPFSPHISKTNRIVKSESFDIPDSNIAVLPSIKGPTIIRAKPARPKPPKNMSLLCSAAEPAHPMLSVNMKMPLQKVTSSMSFDDPLKLSWDKSNYPEGDVSPPMPNIPPPPPPPASAIDEIPKLGDFDDLDIEDPYGVALYNYYSDHPDDLSFSANAKVKLIKRVNEEWMLGRLRNGMQGLFPSNYIEIKVPLSDELLNKSAVALYDFSGQDSGDLPFKTGDKMSILYKINDQWYFGSCKGVKGQIPSNYIRFDSS